MHENSILKQLFFNAFLNLLTVHDARNNENKRFIQNYISKYKN